MTSPKTPLPSRTNPGLRPRDAATLIIVRRDSDGPRVLMGKRHENHKFMPGKFVFPGGRVDAADCRIRPAKDLDPGVAERLMTRMRGRTSQARARGLAMAAVRETFEEVGLVVGTPESAPATTRSVPWQQFAATGYAPDLSGLRFLLRAITPPGRPRRFDTRFFVLDAARVANLDAPLRPETDELLDPYWVTFDEARTLDLPWITGQVLKRLAEALDAPDGLAPGAPAVFQYMIGKSWRYETV